MDVSPKQVISIAAGMIPFLEHDDANRALMGANMQRQGVPLLQAESPFVGTGIEERVARDSKIVVVAEEAGVVASVDAKRIVVTKDGELPRSPKTDPKNHTYVYELRKFMRSNAGTCFNQKPIVKLGPKGQGWARSSPTVLRPTKAKWPSAATCSSRSCRGTATTSRTRSSSPRRSLREDIFTSIHIQEFEVTARDTKLGPEEITRDIPNVGRRGPQEPRPQRRHPHRCGG
jgi:DNA-directed RNA polymerase subunit beta